jgi:NAD(P)-dependent dehydrogenase (short-subunit alcohol dehydrogenase family)
VSRIGATGLLRPGLLEGVAIVLAGVEGGASHGARVHDACASLGARVLACRVAGGEAEEDVEAAVERLLADAPEGVGMLVVDGAGLFATAEAAGEAEHADAEPGEGPRALRDCLDASWNVTRALVNRAFLPAGRGGRIVYIAPPVPERESAREHAEAARAGLENLARTLSIEWARHGILAVAIAPGAGADEAAALVAYLASPAGAYFSGCLLDLRGPAGR